MSRSELLTRLAILAVVLVVAAFVGIVLAQSSGSLPAGPVSDAGAASVRDQGKEQDPRTGSSDSTRLKHNTDSAAAAPSFVIDATGNKSAIAGRVVNERGAPLAGAKVYLGEAPREIHVDDSRFQNMPNVMCDEQGQFVVESPPKGLTHLTVYAPEYQVTVHELSATSAANNDLILQLLPGAVLEGAVIDGSDPAGGDVRIEYVRETVKLSDKATPGDGFRFTGLPGGEVEISVTLNADYARSRQRWMRRIAVLAAGETTRADFHFVEGSGFIEGRVLFDETPAERAFVQAHVQGLYGDETRSARTENDGFYRVENVPAGDVVMRVTAVPPGAEQGARQRNHIARFSISDEETLERNIDMIGSARIAGQAPEANVFYPRTVHLLSGEFVFERQQDMRGSEFAAYLVASANVGEGGAFQFDGLHPGTYTVVTNWKDDLLLSKAVNVGDGAEAYANLTVPE